MRDERKVAKKEKKNTEASKRGKKSKRVGRYSEKALEKLILSWGYPCRRIPLSGALKTTGLDSDLRIEIQGKEYKVENKKRETFGSYYKRIEENPIVIVGREFVMMSQEAFQQFLLGVSDKAVTIPNKRFKFITDTFAQDDSDIVTLTSNYKPYIFCIKFDLWLELRGEKKEDIFMPDNTKK